MIPVAGWVAPFGDPGITDRSHLPRAFRSVPRPSSPLSAKASTRCPSSLVHRSLPQKRPRHRRAQGQTPLSREPPMPRRSRMKTLLEQTPSLSNAGLSASVTSSTLSSPFNQPRRRTRPRRLFYASPNALAPTSIGASRRRSAGPVVSKASPSPVVEVNGLEPMTSCLQSRRSPS